jgi:hypothetical protein
MRGFRTTKVRPRFVAPGPSARTTRNRFDAVLSMTAADARSGDSHGIPNLVSPCVHNLQ